MTLAGVRTDEGLWASMLGSADAAIIAEGVACLKHSGIVVRPGWKEVGMLEQFVAWAGQYGAGNGWWSVCGLITDVLGFSILAAAILAEDRLNRLALRMGSAVRWLEHVTAPPQFMSGPDGLNTERAMAARRDVAVRLASLLIARGYRSLKSEATRRRASLVLEDLIRVASGSGLPFLPGDPGLDLHIKNLAREVQSITKDEERRFKVRPRAFTVAAIFLIVTGFLLQAWGSIPVEPPPPNVYWVGWLG